MLACRALALLGPIAAAPVAAYAQAGDGDRDGVPDQADAFPCDWRRSAVSFVPSEHEFATQMFEDNWPARGDLDFNDAVLLHNFALYHDAQGALTGLRVVLVPRALGASFESGVALSLPIAATHVRSIVRTIGGEAPSNLTVVGGESNMVVPLVSSLRAMWAGATGFINTDPSVPALGDASPVVVEIELRQPVSVSGVRDALDLYFFRSGDPSYQIHRPQFSGTDGMRRTLFGTADDGSTDTRSFVDTDGLPFVLVIPQGSVWPIERGHVESLWPDLVEFAASGGVSALDFYATNVDLTRAYPMPVGVAVPGLAYGACVAATCTDGARNGVETDVDCGGGCAPCRNGGGCQDHDDCAGAVCAENRCGDGDQRSCVLSGGSGVQTRSGGVWSDCVATSCDATFHLEAGACASDVRACAVDNGDGSQQWSGGAWGPCVPVSCAAGYRFSDGACVLVTYAWSSGAWGACAGGAGAPSYGPWGTCSGGSGVWAYDAWGACSAAEVCSGAGTEVRAATCGFTSGSGVESRSASCAWVADSGVQSRVNTCMDNFGEVVSAALCTSAAPTTSQSCTPAGAPGSCGALATTQACTPSNPNVCGAAVTTRACTSPTGARACAVTNGVGTQSCAGGGTTWTACVPTQCDAGFYLVNGACNPPACDDGILNGTEQNVDCGGNCRSCLEAVTDVVSVDEGEQVSVPMATLLANDYAVPQGGPATITAVDGAVGGTVQISGDQVLFRSTGASGQAASFRYTIQNSVGYTSSVVVTVNVTLPLIEALMVDTTADLNTLTGAGTGYVPPTALQIFNTWQRFSHSGSTRPPVNTTELNSWRYVAASDTVESTVNSTTFIGFISPDALSNYTMETTLTALSSSGDNDAIAIIVAFASEGTPGTAGYREYTISAIRNRPASGDTHTRVGTTVVRWALVYNYNQSDARVLANSSALTSATTGWNGSSTRTRVRIERRGDQISALASNFNSTTLVEASRMNIDLSSAPDLARFSGPRPWGMGALSQSTARFTERVFSGGLNASVIHDASVTPARVLDYNATSGSWTVRAGATPQTVLGCPRAVRRPAITTVTPAIAAQDFYMTCASISRL